MFDRIKEELLDKDARACLPRNLSDEWLSYLSVSTAKMLGADEDVEGDGVESVHREASLAVVIRLLDAKTERTGDQLEVPIDALHDYLEWYRIELALEEVHRKTDVKYEPATLATILTSREVNTWRE